MIADPDRYEPRSNAMRRPCSPCRVQRYEIAHFKTVRVHIDYHIEVKSHRYSVPHGPVGQALEARMTTGDR